MMFMTQNEEARGYIIAATKGGGWHTYFEEDELPEYFETLEAAKANVDARIGEQETYWVMVD